MRGAMGAGVLSAALLLGGPMALATADEGSGSTGSSGAGGSSSSESQSTGSSGSTSSSPSSSPKPRTDFGSSLRQGLRDIRTSLGSITDRRSSSTAGNDSTTVDEADSPASIADAPDVTPEVAIEIVAPESETVVAKPPAVTAPITTPTASPTPKVAPLSAAGTPSGPPTSKGTNATRPPLPFAKVPEAVAAVGDTVTTVLDSTHDTIAALPALLATLPNSRTPVTDVITTIEYMLTSVSSVAGAITALPTDLSALMGVPLTPVTEPVATPPAPRPAYRAAPAGLADLMLVPASLGSPVPGSVAEVPVAPALLSAATTANLPRATVATPVPVALRGIAASGTPDSLLDRAVNDVLLPLSLAALAAVALPGVGGLLVICALGVRIGYRQAKAGWAIHVAGIGRFAGPGPLGVVRSGSLVALHTPRGRKARAADGNPGVVRFLDRSDRAA
ncbi:hypothetical protein [Mycobacterium sp. C31M]